MASLIDTIRNMVPADAASSLASRFGESPGSIGGALGGVVPALLGGMLSKAEGDGAGELANLVGRAADRAPSPDGEGGGLAQSLFGGKLGAIASALAGTFGVKPETITGLMGYASPLVADGVASQLGGNVTPDGVRRLLEEQKGEIASALPGGLAGMLGGLGGIGAAAAGMAGSLRGHASDAGAAASGAGADFAGRARDMGDAAAAAGGGFGKWLPWIIGAVVLLALIWGLRSCQHSATVAPADNTMTPTETVAPSDNAAMIAPEPAAPATPVAIPTEIGRAHV